MHRRDFLRAGAALGAAGLGPFLTPAARGTAQQAVAAAPRPGEAALRLNWNENPLGPSPAARRAALAALDNAHHYPDELRGQLRQALAERASVPMDCVVLGCGSSEILQMIVQAAASPNRTLVLASPTFEAITRYQRPLAYHIEKVPLDGRHGHDIGRMRELAGSRPAVIYICNPNNPTGTLTASAEIDAWIAEAPQTTLFAVDEAYFEYVRAPGYGSAVKWIDERPNVIVVRTFSKIYGMAGMRIGYAFAHPATARRLREFMSSDNANGPALAAALASLADTDLIRRSRAANEKAKAIVTGCLDELGLEHLPSHTNFVMHRVGADLDDYIRRMRERGFRVGRPFPPMLEHNRLTLGLPDDMRRFTDTLRDFSRRGWV